MNVLSTFARPAAPRSVVLAPRLRILLGRSRFRAGGTFHLVALAAVVLCAVAVSVVSGWELERRRADVLGRAAAEAAALAPRQRLFLPRSERWILEEAVGPYRGDEVSPDLGWEGALDARLSAPGVYLRGVPEELASADALARAARGSVKDAFVLCLLEPPATADSKGLLEAVTRYYLRGALFEDATARVRPMREVEDALRVLTPAWAAEVRQADASLWMRRLELEIGDRSEAVRAAGRAAAMADTLLLVIDEVPPDVRVPEVGPAITDHQRESVLPQVEERPHTARVVMIDLENDRVLLRLRRRLDAGALGVPSFALRRQALQGCQLAMEARAAVEAALP